ncbi:MAG: MFS transporter [Synergistaceae bacterium]|nr:MFS transporter [Synergistaceae bacterium]
MTIYSQRHMLYSNPFKLELALEQPSYVSTSPEGVMLVVDRSKTRVSVIREGSVRGIASGGVETEGFYYAEYAVTDGEKVYIADVRYDSVSTNIAAERVIQYSADGRYEKILFERLYEDARDKLMQYGNIRSLQYYGGSLFFVLKGADSLDLHRISDGQVSIVRGVLYDALSYADSRHVLYDAPQDAIYVMNLRCELYSESNGVMRSAYDWSGDGRGQIPWEIATGSGGRLFATDLAASRVVSLPEYAEVFKTKSIPHGMTVNEKDIISVADAERVYQTTGDGALLYSGDVFPLSKGFLLGRFVIWGLLLAVFAEASYLVIRLAARAASEQSSVRVRLTLAVGVSVVITSSLVCAGILRSESERMSETRRQGLVQLAQAMSKISQDTYGDSLESITSLGDHGGDAFNRVRSFLAPPCDSAAREGAYMYYAVMKFSWEEDALYGVMDYEDTIPTVYPIGAFAGSGYDEIAKGDVPYMYRSESDVYGAWTFVAAPAYNSAGDIVGLIEFGYNLFSDRLAKAAQIRETALGAAVLVIIFLLLSSEIVAVSDCGRDFPRLRAGPGGSIPEFIRSVTFIAFFADNVSAAFIAQLSARVYESSSIALPISGAMSSALPLSVKLFSVALSSAAAGRLIGRLGQRRVLCGGILAQSAGLAVISAAVAAGNYWMLLAGEAATGVGLSLSTVVTNAVPMCFQDESRRNSLLGGVNTGIMSGVVVGASIGPYIAEVSGYPFTFGCASALTLSALFFGYACTPGDAPAMAASADSRSISTGRFLADRHVCMFFLLLMLPFNVILGFKDYVFPLYVSGLGYSDVTIGQVLLFSGAAAIFAGAPLAEYIRGRIGAKYGNVAVNLAYISGIIIFGVIPSFASSVIAACVINILDGFGMVIQNIYFATLGVVIAYGGDRSMGIYNLASSLALASGPAVLGALLGMGYDKACLLVGGAGTIFLLIFIMFGVMENRFVRTEGEGRV